LETRLVAWQMAIFLAWVIDVMGGNPHQAQRTVRGPLKINMPAYRMIMRFTRRLLDDSSPLDHNLCKGSKKLASDILRDSLCSHRHSELHLPPKRSLRLVSDAAQRLQALLEVSDMLTEKPELTEMDIIALDVLLAAGRDQAGEVIRLIGQLSAAADNAGAVPRQ
jgi:hypothetical protein